MYVWTQHNTTQHNNQLTFRQTLGYSSTQLVGYEIVTSEVREPRLNPAPHPCDWQHTHSNKYSTQGADKLAIKFSFVLPTFSRTLHKLQDTTQPTFNMIN